MNAKTPEAGRPFADDYREESYGDDEARLQHVLRQQVAELGGGGRTNQDMLVGILIGRRSGRLDLPQPEARPTKTGTSYVARGEIVLRATDYRAGSFREVLDRERFRDDGASRWPGGGGLVRVRRLAGGDVSEVLTRYTEPADAWQNHLATMAAVGKGIGGPEPAPTIGGYADYRAAWTARHGDAAMPRVAVVDTGLPARRRHSDGWLDLQRTLDDVDELDVLPAGSDGYLDFQAGHGTFVAGIVQRIAPTADVRMYRAADTDGFAADDDIADALRAAHADGARIISLSLGGQASDDQPPPAMAGAVRDVLADGETVVIAAAGNFGNDEPCFPAAIEGVVAVAGLTAQGTRADWSSYGRHVRFSTVAEGIRSTFVTGRESPVFDPEPEAFGDDAWAMWSGTSFAAPQIAGAVARVCGEEGVPPRQAVEVLAGRGVDAGDDFGAKIIILEGLPIEGPR